MELHIFTEPQQGASYEQLERVARRTEELGFAGFWRAPEGEGFTFRGRFYSLEQAPGLPKPRQRPGPPIIMGGSGKHRGPALAARFASEYNVAFRPLRWCGEQFDRVRLACELEARDPESMRFSVALTVACGRNRAEFERRAAAIGRAPAELLEDGLGGTPDQVVDRVQQAAAIGCQRVYAQLLDLDDLEHLELLAADVLPRI